jgi:hypothetical protein
MEASTTTSEAIDDSSSHHVTVSDDDVSSVDTPRMWALSMLFAILGSSLNLFFSLRYPSISLSPILALLISHPLGLSWDAFFKESEIVKPSRPSNSLVSSEEASPLLSPLGDAPSISRARSPATDLTWRQRCMKWLGQGRWNEKEHCCVFISSSVSFGFAFATDVGPSSHQTPD